ncbi:hypothetical protein C8244_01045 [Paracidovorax avenae]|uniref:hypothetical protein n=1 Tax=Paracidovorax avenae TaxID=80867 RepID=UPI000D1632C6|nr:hypothetical protein [Paracidovorax avenae]AVS79828.1 hypothetical protein C8237_01065 [Paracidovorax avenae]AVT14944.1 hypothetical protein C8244_01045 [Paracidovorax avenae]
MQNTTIARPLRRARPARLALACALALAASAAGVAPAWAQTTAAAGAEPEPGMWAFDGELTGQPGRSLQIDTQLGRGMVVSYLGYRADGSALFLQASGYRAQDDNSFTGELREFRNGPVIGGGAANGEVAGSVGTLRLAFDTPTSGTVTLPGEAPRRISRFTYGNQQLSRDFDRQIEIGLYSQASRSPRTATYRMRLSDSNLRLEQLSSSDGSLCAYSGPYQVQGGTLASQGTKVCTDASGAQQQGTYRIERFRFDSQGFLSGNMEIDGTSVVAAGACWMTGAVNSGTPAPCSAHFYGGFALQTGMWSFDDELNGRPGRSLQIENLPGSGVLIVSYLGYRADGSSMFLQGATTTDMVQLRDYAIPLKEFRNGPVIGGSVTPGQEAASVGTAQLVLGSTSGTITLPGDTPRRISRYRYEDHTVRFGKAFDGGQYLSPYPPGGSVAIKLDARNGVFRMDTLSRGNNQNCQYQGSYELAGDGITTYGSMNCSTDNGGTGSTIRTGYFTVDANGMLRGTLRHAFSAPYLFAAGCVNSDGRLCTRDELQQPR